MLCPFHFNQTDLESNEIQEEETEWVLDQESSPLELSNCKLEFLIPPESENSEYLTTSSFFSACSESLQSRESSITELTERSKLHWSQLIEYSDRVFMWCMIQGKELSMS